MPKPNPELSAEEEIREAARRVREFEEEDAEETPDSIVPESELDRSAASYRETIRGPSLFALLKRKFGKRIETMLVGLITGALGTTGGAAYEASKPGPGVVEIQKLTALMEAERHARQQWQAVAEALAKERSDAAQAAQKQLREDLYKDYRATQSKLEELHEWRAEIIRKERFKAAWVE